MALDDVTVAESGQAEAPMPVDLGTLDAATGAPSPTALDLIGGVDEAPPAPDPALYGGGALSAIAAADDGAPAPSPTQGEPPGGVAATSEAPGPMEINRLNELEQR